MADVLWKEQYAGWFKNRTVRRYDPSVDRYTLQDYDIKVTEGAVEREYTGETARAKAPWDVPDTCVFNFPSTTSTTTTTTTTNVQPAEATSKKTAKPRKVTDPANPEPENEEEPEDVTVEVTVAATTKKSGSSTHLAHFAPVILCVSFISLFTTCHG
ncbi:hypothetical protein RvY_01906 [Ramazzottius varieornatus]|uniref:Uncharacterized protein n=1 Tax=Ramazzottius varieornatus TaxID=947166 RepID=A0A1D1UI10_RAMVA|nr:hypothetical protein RvY_01906 [Ramazzottius varieornatus]